jgi:2-phospho-L-lactate guanylyltransferase (CobY/MobA/RfbA family)
VKDPGTTFLLARKDVVLLRFSPIVSSGFIESAKEAGCRHTYEASDTQAQTD